jgi:uncharacterized phage-associated protein
MYKANDIAAFIIEYENAAGRHINYLRICRYLYFIQAQFLVNLNKPCFEDKILAWDCGPMVESVGREYRIYGNCNIYRPRTESAWIHHKDRTEIISMLNELAKYSNTKLSSFIFQQTPWKKARYHSIDNEITKYSLYSFFKED